jgi:hypothetical protein
MELNAIEHCSELKEKNHGSAFSGMPLDTLKIRKS